MSSAKKKSKFDPFLRGKSMNRSLRKKDRKRRLCDLHVGIQDKLEREIKLRDGASRMLAACTHEDQLLEVAKTLHTSNARMYTYMAELQKLKTAEIMEKAMDEEGYSYPIDMAGCRKIFRCQSESEVQDTELVCMDKTTTDLIFRDVLVFEDASHNFKMDIEIHAFPMAGEPVSAPTPQKLLSRLNRSIGKSEGKRIRDRMKESPATNMKMSPQYEKLGSLTLDITCIDDNIRSHDIIKEVGKTLPCWSYMWCEVKAGKMLCWLNPEDTPCKSPQWTIDIMATDIKIQEIEKVRQKRPNSFQIRDFENRHMFSASTKDDMARWIRNLRQHRSDCAAWSKAYLPNKTGARPMFIASPSPFNSPAKLLFDASARNSSIYQQLSMDSPTKSDNEPVSVGDLVKKTPSTPQPSSAHASKDSNPSTTPWAGLFNGALNRSATKVTKLKDVQNIMNTDSTKKCGRLRTKSFDGILTSMRSSKHKKDFSKPPIPRRPSEEKIRERQKLHSKSPTSAIHAARIESLKSCFTSESCSETCPSDVGLSSDDVFLSSDDNLLNSPNVSKPSSARKKGKKKRKAPLPPLPDPQTIQNNQTQRDFGSKAKASLSSASSLDDVLDKKIRPQKPPRSEARSARQKAGLNYWETDSEGRKSQLSLISNHTQLSNTSSGYKSDSEGLSSVPKSPYTNRNLPKSERHHYEVVILNEDLQANKEKTRIRVLPHFPSSVSQTRSHSLGSNTIDRGKNAECVAQSNSKYSSDSINVSKAARNMKDVPQIVSTAKCEHPKSPLSLCQKPIPAPRRSYLTAVESSQVSSPGKHLYDEPLDPPNLKEDPNYDEIESLYAKPTPKCMRTVVKAPPISDVEPIYAQVDKSKKSKHLKNELVSSTNDHIKSQKTVSHHIKPEIERVVEDTDAVFV